MPHSTGWQQRITTNPKVVAGKPTIRGLRISVEQVLRALAHQVPAEDLLRDYPELESEDIQACLDYAADRVAEERVYPTGGLMQPDPSSPAASPAPQDDIPLCREDPLPPGLRPVPPGILRSLTAFRRDLPELMKTHYGQWVAYHGDERLGFGRHKTPLFQECLRRGLQRGEFIVYMVIPEIPYDEDGYLYMTVRDSAAQA